MSKKKYNGIDLRVSRENARQTQIQAAVEIDTSQSTIVNFENRDVLPKSPHIQRAIFEYIDKYL